VAKTIKFIEEKRCKMATAQVVLTEAEAESLETLSRNQGKAPEDLLHEAVAQFLWRHDAHSRLAALRGARGIWRERRDIPELNELRSEWNRNPCCME
jgi:hypothetical protein